MTKKEALKEVFWKAFEGLPHSEQRGIAEKIIDKEDLWGDLIDHRLVEASKKERGRDIPLSDYVNKKKTRRYQ